MGRPYGFILFDFDGTIMDTSEGIRHSFDRVVDVYHPDIPGREVYERMIGPPLPESLASVFRLKEEDIRPAMKVYRSYYAEKGMFESRPYDGIVELLRALRQAGKKVFTATSKPEPYTRRILEAKGMLGLFDFVGGSDLEENRRAGKADVIRYVLAENGLAGRTEDCVMVGDTRFDILGAQETGLDSVGVLYGFGSEAELRAAGAGRIVASVEELGRLLLS
ncbi:MAG TPA: phosphoglycolate phosphatase [Treponema sp.]|nr:phosphoglycolate phosphatase [Treponema sp.]